MIIYADPKAYAFLLGYYPAKLLQKATEESFGTEFLDYKMAIKTVSDLKEALDHIARFSSKHSESIVSEDAETCEFFERAVDAACVYTNVSTAFTDGAQFGLGARNRNQHTKASRQGANGSGRTDHLQMVDSWRWTNQEISKTANPTKPGLRDRFSIDILAKKGLR